MVSRVPLIQTKVVGGLTDKNQILMSAFRGKADIRKATS